MPLGKRRHDMKGNDVLATLFKYIASFKGLVKVKVCVFINICLSELRVLKTSFCMYS